MSARLAVMSGLVLGSLPALPAHAAAVQCGETVTRDFVLTVDLVNCPEAGLVVGAPGITIDLAGHTIDSSAGEDLAIYPPAIDNLAGHDNVTVKNGGGSTDYWSTYHAVGADGFRVIGVTGHLGRDAMIEDSTGGIVRDTGFVEAQDVTKSRFERNGGAQLYGSSDNIVTRTRGDIGSGNIGIFEGSNRNRIVRNALSAFKPLFLVGSHGNRIRHNTFKGSVEPIFLDGSHRNVIARNWMKRATDGAYGVVLLKSHHNAVRRNVVTRSLLIDKARTSGGVLLCGARRNLIRGNTFTDQFVGIGVDNDISCGADLVSNRNRLANNVITGSNGASDYPEQTGDGITIGARSQRTFVVGNTLLGNHHHGIAARSPSTTITGNVALNNRRLGIRAVPGVNDGGGNIALGNRTRQQCVGVVCR